MFNPLVWPVFWGSLYANLVTVLIVYALVMHHRGERTGTVLVKAGRLFMATGSRAIQVFISAFGLLLILVTIKLLIWGD